MAPSAWFCGAPESDLVSLVTRSDEWARARALTRVVQFYMQQITGVDWPALRDAGLISYLRDHHLELSVEIGSVKPGHEHACDATHNIAAAKFTIDEIEKEEGGHVDYLCIDEPLVAGIHLGCGMSIDSIADAHARFHRELRPRVGNLVMICGYPINRPDVIVPFWQALADRNVLPDGMHLDVDVNAIGQLKGKDKTWVPEVMRLQRMAKDFGMPFGLIAWAQFASTDAQYRVKVMDWVHRYRAAGIHPDREIVQSWERRGPNGNTTGKKDIPRCLPDTEPDSHTGILLEIASTRTW